VILQELPEGEGVLLHAETEQYYALSATATVAVRLLDSGEAMNVVVDALCDRFDVDRDTARGDVASLVDDLVREQLVLPPGA
jgi:hypothetical protein